jgi:hypothetical protein
VACVTIPQVHHPGQEAEVDFAELWVWLEGTLTKLWLFTMRLSCSGRAFHQAFATQAQEAFFEGHVLGFAHFGGVPCRVRYDNLKPAVTRILQGRNRIENERFITLRSHYGFDSFFCLPGKQGAHEKGGVEVRAAASAAVTWSRSRWSPPSASSTSTCRPPTPPMTPAGSAIAPAPSATTSRQSSPTCWPCPPPRLMRPASCRHAGLTTRPVSVCASTTIRSRPGSPAAPSTCGWARVSWRSAPVAGHRPP